MNSFYVNWNGWYILVEVATVAETMIASIGPNTRFCHRHHNDFNVFSNSIKYVPCLIRRICHIFFFFFSCFVLFWSIILCRLIRPFFVAWIQFVFIFLQRISNVMRIVIKFGLRTNTHTRAPRTHMHILNKSKHTHTYTQKFHFYMI